MSRIRNSTSQMQPHFLYNALGSIQELILIDPAYASDLLGDFMVHLRSCVRAMENDKPIPFSEELKNIRAYTNIEKMRLGKKLDVKYEIQESNFFVLPLSIQPLVENAIRHGIHKRGKTGGTVTLRTKKTDNAWIIEVEDDGVGFNVDQIHEEIRQKKRSSTGLKNIRFRIKAVLNGSLNITSKEGEGTVVTVSIPRT
jgi:sensor histidine kinase YesM